MEAQNALLKTIEEPRGNAVFFFLLPAPERLLPTFLSRAQILQSKKERHPMSLISVRDFLKSAPSERIALLEPFTKKLEKDEERDMAGIAIFLDELERALCAQPAGLHAVYRAKKYITDRGAMVKPLLEQVALLA